MTLQDEQPSDRQLLLQEIQSLSRDVGRLRGDTKSLVQEEVSRNRWKNVLLIGLVFLVLAVPLVLFFVHQTRLNEQREEFIRRTAQACEERNSDTLAIGTFLQRLNEAPRHPDQAPPSKEAMAAYQEFVKSLEPVDCNRLLEPSNASGQSR